MLSSSFKKPAFLLPLLILQVLQSRAASIVYDTSKVVMRSPSTDQIKEVVEDSKYVYDRVPPSNEISDGILAWLVELFSNITKSGFLGFSTVTIILASAALVLIIILLSRNDVRGMLSGKTAKQAISFTELEEDIHTIDFDKLITEAISRKDFRKAIRLHFLKLLKELSDKNIIQWKIDKTNNDYAIELAQSRYRESFSELATLYEYFWYGDFHTTEEHFREAIVKFNSFRL
jgi:hypothetical protein